LDLGCGNGRWGEILIPRCKEYVGVDLSKNFIEKAQKQYKKKNARFICNLASEFIDKSKYDLILIIGLTTYMNDEDIEKMSYNCREMLSRGGMLVVRSVTIKDAGSKRMVFHRKTGFFSRMVGRREYQIIRRTPEEEMRLFKEFSLEDQEDIPGTGYLLYILR